MNIFLVVKNNFKRAFRYKLKFLFTLLIPIIVIVLTIFVNTFMKPAFHIGIIKNASSNKIDRIIKLLDNTEGLSIHQAKEESIQTDIIMAKYSAVLSFNKDPMKNDPKEIENYIGIHSQKKNIEQNMISLIKYYISHDKPVKIKNYFNELTRQQMSIGQRITGFIMMCLMITSTMTATIIIKDKEEKILTRFRYSPNKLTNYTLGNLIYNFIITYGQLFLASMIIAIFHIEIGISTIEFLALSLFTAFVATSFGTFMASAFKSEMQASLVSSAIALMMTLFGGGFIPIDMMPEGLKFISQFTLTRWMIEFSSVLEKSQSFIDGIRSTSILVIAGIVCLVLSSLLNKRKVTT